MIATFGTIATIGQGRPMTGRNETRTIDTSGRSPAKLEHRKKRPSTDHNGSIEGPLITENGPRGRRAGSIRSSEIPFRDDDGVAGLHEVPELRLDLDLVPLRKAHDLDPVRRPAFRHAASQRERLQHGHLVLLKRVRSWVLHLS